MGISKTHIHSPEENEFAAIAKVLAHPARIAILSYIASKNGCLCKDIADRIKLSQPTISHHLQVIRRSGVLNYEFVGGVMYYKLNNMVFYEMKDRLGLFFESVIKRAYRIGKD